MKKDIIITDNESHDFIALEEYKTMDYQSQLNIDTNFISKDSIYIKYHTYNMVAVYDTLEEASRFLGCHVNTLYNSFHKTRTMQYKHYTIDIIERLEE